MSDAQQRDAAWQRLRGQAEVQVRGRLQEAAPAVVPMLDELLHEVEVQRAELEIQNESLRVAEVSLGQAQRRYFGLFDHAPVGVFVLRPDGSIEEVNSTARKWLGMPERFSGPATLASVLHTSETRVQAWLEFFRHHQSAPAPATLHVQVARVKGEPLDLELSGAVTVGTNDAQEARTLVCATNLTELRARERELARSEARYRQLFQSSRDAILLLDESLSIVDLNASAVALLPSREEPAVGRVLTSMVVPEVRAVVERAFEQRARRWVPEPFDLPLARARHTPIICEAMVFPLDVDSKTLVQVVLRDVTERRRAEVERAQVAQRLDTTNRLEAIARLGRGVVEQLNQSLMSLLGRLETLPVAADGVRTLGGTDYQAIRSAVMRGRDVMRGLLDFAGESPAVRARFDLSVVLDDAASLVRQAGRGHVRVTLNRPERVLPVDGDRAELSRALLDVLTRAISTLPDGGQLEIIVATVETPAAQPDEPPTRWHRIEVADTGPPLSPADRASIFDPFRPVGTGGAIGLSAVWGAVKRAGGVVRVDTRATGNSVTLEIPAAPETPLPG